jgi:thiamine biosynthesis lipoprotein
VRAEALMGTVVTIDAVGVERDAAIDRAFEWFRLVEATCTRFEPQSELCQLTTRPGSAVTVSRLLFEAIRFAIGVAEASEGAFDPTIGATLQRRGFDREHRTGLAAPVMVEPSDGVSFRDVTLDEEAQTVTLQRPLLLDLGAVAKGLAVDLAARELAPLGNFAIDAGGDLYLGGRNHDGESWSIGIRHPRQPGTCIAAVRVSDRAICTSGDYERQMPGQPTTPGARTSGSDHHILDPRSGTSPVDTASVTVIAPSAMLADALATTAFVLGPDEGRKWLEHMGVEGLIVTSALGVIQTQGWPGA